jgi:two-component system OmpR family response regulator
MLEQGAPAPCSFFLGAMRVLVIEDDPHTREFIVQGLRESGHGADASPDGNEGLELAIERDYDAIVLDRMLPGLEALHRRRDGNSAKTWLKVADLEMDLLARRVKRAGKPIELQPREFRLLEYLMRHSGQVVTRTMLLEKVWDYHFDPQTNVIDVHVSRLRSKIDKGFDPPLLHTVRGAGYALRAP